MWSGLTPDISHLRIFGCSAYVTINKKKRRKLDPKSREMTFISYEPGSKGYQFWDKDSRSVIISRDVKFDQSKFPHRKDLDYKNPFADEKRRSISVKNQRKTTDESDTNTEEGLVIPSTSDSDDDHRPSHPAPPPPGAPPPVPPKNSPGPKNTGGKRQKPLGQMKSLALPFHQNPTLEAVFLEVRDHGITCDQGSDTISPKRVRHDSLKVCPQKDLVRN